MKYTRRPKKYMAYVALLATAVFIVLWSVGSKLTTPANMAIGDPPPDVNGKSVVINGVHGWFIPGSNSKQCILLLHGVRSNRKSMLDRARMFNQEGYSTFLVDLQAHGETDGKNITFGYEESKSAHAAVSYMQDKGQCEKIASLGQSLGGAASLLGEHPIDVDALIIESVYSTIETAVFNRVSMRVGNLAYVLAPLIYQQIPLRLGINLEDLHPINAIQRVNVPILIVAGSEDKHTTLLETQQMYEQALAPKELYVVKGAAHVDLFRFAPRPYQARIIGFLNKYLLY